MIDLSLIFVISDSKYAFISPFSILLTISGLTQYFIFVPISFSQTIIVTLFAPFLYVSNATSTAELPAPTIAIFIL